MGEPTKQIEKIYNQTDLYKMSRAEVDQLAVDQFNLKHAPKEKNKNLVINQILELQGNAKSDPDSLTEKEELFCQLYASEKEFFGNGTQAYIEAFNVNMRMPGAYNAARSSAARLLTKSNVLAKINELLDELMLNDQHIDKQIGFLVTQNADFPSKLGAIKEYNRMRERVREAGGNTVNMNFFSFHDKRAQEMIDAHKQWVMEQTKAEVPSESTTE